MKIIDDKALVLRLKNPAPVLAAAPDARPVDANTVAVKWDIPNVHALRDLGFEPPSPIERRYNWPGKHKPMSHQRDTAAFLTLNRKAFCFSEPGCVDSETEYLSPTGWVKISEYAGGKVAQYHPDTGEAEFVDPDKFVKLPCDTMVRIKTKYGLDQMLSPEHRTLLRSNAADKWCVMSAADVLQAHDDYHAGAVRPNMRKAGSSTVGFSHMAIPTAFHITHGAGMNISDAALRLQVAVIADGHFAGAPARCIIRVKRERKVVRMRELLTAAGVEYRERLQNTATAKDFHLFTFDAPMRCKEFGPEFWQCNAAQRSVVADEVFHWDGSDLSGSRGHSFTSTSRASADFIQYVWSSSGRTARMHEDRRPKYRGGVCYVVTCRGGTRGGAHGLLAIRNRRSPTVTEAPSTDGFKYCFMVPSTYLIFRRNGCVFASGNTGKTASAIWAADFLMQQGMIQRVLVICPVSIMDAAWRNDLFTFAMHRKVDVAYGSAQKRGKIIASDAEFVIINYDGVKVSADDIVFGGFDLIIVDECFVAGTKVHTPEGLKPIETLKAGDEVFTSNGVAHIKTVSSRMPQDLVEVKLSDGKAIKCTPEHPFFTDHGWVPAHALAGRQLIAISDMPYLLGTVHSANGNMEVPQKKWHPHRDELFAILRSEEVALATPGASRSTFADAGATRTEYCDSNRGADVSRNETTPITHRQGERLQPPSARGERDRDVTVREYHSAAAARGVGVELPSSVGETAAELSYKLQARLRLASEQSGVGGGRKLPSDRAGARTGQEKDEGVGATRVDSVSYCERGSLEPVYNIEVDGTPNYFVGDGYLVHNCSAYQNAQTARWKVLNKLVGPDTWLWMMTGTPAAQGPDYAYGLAKLVNPKAVPRHFGAFRDMVMYKITQFKWGVKESAPETVHRVLQPAIRFSKEDCLDLPDLVYVSRAVEMTAQQKRFYHKLRKDLLLEAAGENVTAGTAAVAMTKLLQISSGSVYTDDQNTLQFDISSRYKVLMEVIAETPSKVLIFVPFRNAIELLAQKLAADKISCEVIDGGVPASKRTEVFNAFQNNPDPRVLVIQPQAAAHGVTLTAADTVVWWGPTASLEIYEQANARIHRKGQTRKCTIVQLIGSPIEERVYKLLDSKIDIHRQVIDLYANALD